METKKIEASYEEIFKMLGLESKEDREKYVFGATTLEKSENSDLKTEYIVVKP